MILSILIPTLPERFDKLKRIKTILEPQVNAFLDQVEIIIDDRGKTVTTGEKRNYLIKQASGQYIVFVDDDDWVPPSYVQDIINASEQNPDCITFRGWMTTDGKSRVNFILRKGEKYEERGGIYYRWPNHITPIKREIAEKVKFPHVVEGEDYRWSKTINDMRLIKSEVHIDKELYHYDYWVKK